MTKLLEAKNGIKTYLREYDEIYSSHFKGSFTPEIQAMCDKVQVKLTPHVDRLIRELAKENDYFILFGAKKEDSEFFKHFDSIFQVPPTMEEIITFNLFLGRTQHMLTLGFLIAHFKDSAEESLKEVQGNHEKDLMDSFKKVLGREYPVDGTADERAEYMIDYTAESLKSFFKIAKEKGLGIAIKTFLTERRWQQECQSHTG